MKHTLIRLLLAAVLCTASFLVPEAPAQVPVRQTLCSSDPIPAGWIKVDEIASPAACGDAGEAWVIEPYMNKAPGSAMVVCADQPTPPGWQLLQVTSTSGQCGGLEVGNVKSIRRVG